MKVGGSVLYIGLENLNKYTPVGLGSSWYSLSDIHCRGCSQDEGRRQCT